MSEEMCELLFKYPFVSVSTTPCTANCCYIESKRQDGAPLEKQIQLGVWWGRYIWLPRLADASKFPRNRRDWIRGIHFWSADSSQLNLMLVWSWISLDHAFLEVILVFYWHHKLPFDLRFRSWWADFKIWGQALLSFHLSALESQAPQYDQN